MDVKKEGDTEQMFICTEPCAELRNTSKESVTSIDVKQEEDAQQESCAGFQDENAFTVLQKAEKESAIGDTRDTEAHSDPCTAGYINIDRTKDPHFATSERGTDNSRLSQKLEDESSEINSAKGSVFCENGLFSSAVMSYQCDTTCAVNDVYEMDYNEAPIRTEIVTKKEEVECAVEVGNVAPIECQESLIKGKEDVCNESGKQLDFESNLHNQTQSGTKPYTCQECGKDFSQMSSLVRHHKTHTGEKPYICQICGKGFSQRSTLFRHSIIHTGEKPYVCQICGKGFNQGSDLVKHKRMHTGDKPYVCQTCGKGYSDSTRLVRHQAIHTGEKPYVCQKCGKGFTEGSYLVKHDRTHTGEKPYVCQECGKGFSQISNLITHQKAHTGEKPYVCQTCGKGFFERAHLLRHHRTHTGEKPYVCQQCGKGFSQKSNLITHYKTHRKKKGHVSQT
ncbi:histone-lysine N-methyltransferase PRDM9-like [Bombina bombina]|uniref:histone-lysine N-methyltransferase PRDM9-like n=1 Tax=Bombina bombina TaxID=8345 RepID=UPI00235AC1D8|nr:histone-lysine N-methyltransferase PRDM9-like [Bombina bombina]